MKAYLKPEEIDLLEKVCTNLRDRLLVHILFHLGCRISEALGIEIKDIDFIHGTVTILHLKIRLKLSCPNCGTRLSKSHKFCPGCSRSVEKALTKEQENKRMRILPLDKDSLKMLNDFIKRGGPINKNGKQFLFNINRHRSWQIVRECAERAGLPTLINPETGKIHGVSPHKLRDAFAVHAIKLNDSGDSLRMLQEHLGHQSFNTTAKYRKISGEEHRQWYDHLWNKDKS